MAEGNGYAVSGMALPRATVPFKIGEEELSVPILRFADLDDLKDVMREMEPGPGTWWTDYATGVLKVVAHQLDRSDLTFTVLRQRLSTAESLQLAAQYNELLRASGFQLPEPEAAPAIPGTGTSTGSAPASPPEEPAAVIPSS